eukprot:COSAG01_NODE_23146_length_827_cov_0.359890_2_plen_55_part_01
MFVGWSRKERWEASDEYRAEVAKKEPSYAWAASKYRPALASARLGRATLLVPGVI